MIWISYVDLFIDFPFPHPVSPQQPSVLGLLATAPPVMTPPPATTPLTSQHVVTFEIILPHKGADFVSLLKRFLE